MADKAAKKARQNPDAAPPWPADDRAWEDRMDRLGRDLLERFLTGEVVLEVVPAVVRAGDGALANGWHIKAKKPEE